MTLHPRLPAQLLTGGLCRRGQSGPGWRRAADPGRLLVVQGDRTADQGIMGMGDGRPVEIIELLIILLRKGSVRHLI